MVAIFTAAFVSFLALASSVSSLAVPGQPAGQPPSTSLQPQFAGNGTLPANQVFIKPDCTRNATATDTTCDGLASQFNITPKQFVGYNDKVNDKCDNLVVGQPYCVAIDASFSPENTSPVKSGSVKPESDSVKNGSDSIFGHDHAH